MAPGLDLDDPQGFVAWVFDPVDGAQGNEGGLVGAQIKHLIFPGDACRPFEDDSVLCAMVMALQAQLRTRFDDDLLDQEPVPLKYEAIYLFELTDGFRAERVIGE